MTTAERRDRVRSMLREWGRVAVAFSGGTDSTLLAAIAVDELGADGVVLLHAAGTIFPTGEDDDVHAFAAARGAQLRELNVDRLLESPEFVANGPDRCYHCRKVILADLLDALKAADIHVAAVLDGANADDLGDHRPGARAALEFGIRHPLQETGLTKAEIRAWSRELGLPTWDKPASPCLASRLPYGERVTREALARVDAAERLLHHLGFPIVRVRHHGRLARIEVPQHDLRRAFGLHRTLTALLKEIGYQYVCLDLEGFRSGALNEVLEK